MMNERIKELEKQSVYYNEDEDTWEFNREKFAELIVRECASWIEKQDCAVHPTAWLLCDEIKQHFGACDV